MGVTFQSLKLSRFVNSESGSNLEGHEFLNEQFARVGNTNATNVLTALTDSTVKFLLSDICVANEPTLLTNVHLVTIAHIEQSFFEESSGAVRNHAISLHFTKTESAVTTPPLSGLSCQNLRRASPSRVNLIFDHVLEALVICWPQKDHDLHLLARKSVVHNFISSQLIPQIVQFGRNLIHSISSFLLVFSPISSLEGRCVSFFAF